MQALIDRTDASGNAETSLQLSESDSEDWLNLDWQHSSNADSEELTTGQM